jgi:hypothetical protein
MARRDIVADRAHDLIEHFDRYVAVYDVSVPFNTEQLAAHRTTITLRRDAGSLTAAVNDPRFVQSLRRTLTAWGLDKRASRLAGESEFDKALRECLAELAALEPYQIDGEVLPDLIPERLWDVISALGVVDNDAKLVGGIRSFV